MWASPILKRLTGFAASLQAWGKTPAATRARKIFNAMLSILILLLLARAIAQVGWEQVVAVVPWTLAFWALCAPRFRRTAFP